MGLLLHHSRLDHGRRAGQLSNSGGARTRLDGVHGNSADFVVVEVVDPRPVGGVEELLLSRVLRTACNPVGGRRRNRVVVRGHLEELFRQVYATVSVLHPALAAA